MMSDIHVRDPMERPLCPKVPADMYEPDRRQVAKFRIRRGYGGPTASPYNGNWKHMPKDF